MLRNERHFTTIRLSASALALGVLICAFSTGAAAGPRNGGGGALGGSLSVPRANLGATANGNGNIAGADNFGDREATRISPRAKAVSNGANSSDRDKGLARAEDRMSVNGAEHSEAVEQNAGVQGPKDVNGKATSSSEVSVDPK